MRVCVLQLGQAVTKNPGYLKLRKIRAAQNIAKTVGMFGCFECELWDSLLFTGFR